MASHTGACSRRRVGAAELGRRESLQKWLQKEGCKRTVALNTSCPCSPSFDGRWPLQTSASTGPHAAPPGLRQTAGRGASLLSEGSLLPSRSRPSISASAPTLSPQGRPSSPTGESKPTLENKQTWPCLPLSRHAASLRQSQSAPSFSPEQTDVHRAISPRGRPHEAALPRPPPAPRSRAEKAVVLNGIVRRTGAVTPAARGPRGAPFFPRIMPRASAPHTQATDPLHPHDAPGVQGRGQPRPPGEVARKDGVKRRAHRARVTPGKSHPKVPLDQQTAGLSAPAQPC